MNELLRQCEMRGTDLQQACSLFWTLGAKQVGRAAISGWRDVIIPALGNSPEQIRLWPFNGSLESLLEGFGSTVIVETYPASTYVQLGTGFRPGEGKRQQSARKRMGSELLNKVHSWNVTLDEDLVECFIDGFGPSPNGEDDFDAIVGLFGMLDVVFGFQPEGAPDTDKVRKIEGWIFGRRM